MRNTLNFTGRRTLSYTGDHPDCKVAREKLDGMSFRAEVTLADAVTSRLPEDTTIWCEAWYRNQFQRVCVGSDTSPPKAFVAQFSLVPSDVARLRVKLVNQSGMILAQTPTIAPGAVDDGTGGASLIGIRELPEMDTPWRVELQPGERPVLLMHGDLGLRERLLSDLVTQQLVLPAALREIALRYLMLDGDSRDAEPWCRRFFEFADRVLGGGVDLPSSPIEGGEFDHIEQWLDRFVGAFCMRHGLLDPVGESQ